MQAKRATWGLVLTPWLGLLLIVSLIIHVRLVFGANNKVGPGTDFPDPLRLHETTFQIVLLFAVLAMPAWFVAICFKRFRLSVSEHLIQIALYVGGFMGMIFSQYFDPTGLVFRLFYW